jgi:hypothetical protein
MFLVKSYYLLHIVFSPVTMRISPCFLQEVCFLCIQSRSSVDLDAKMISTMNRIKRGESRNKYNKTEYYVSLADYPIFSNAAVSGQPRLVGGESVLSAWFSPRFLAEKAVSAYRRILSAGRSAERTWR